MSLVSDALKQLQSKRGWGESRPPASTSAFDAGRSPRRQPPGRPDSAIGRVRLWQIVVAGLAASFLLALVIAGLVLLILHLRFSDQSAAAPKPVESSAAPEPGASVEAIDAKSKIPSGSPPRRLDFQPQPGATPRPRISASVEQRYQLNLIARRGDAIRAIINHQSVQVGDYLADNVQVVDIQTHHVDLAIDGEIFRLRP